MGTVFARESGLRLHNGVPVNFTRDEAWDDSSSFVKAYPDLFAARPSRVRDEPAASVEKIERATRRPGERR